MRGFLPDTIWKAGDEQDKFRGLRASQVNKEMVTVNTPVLSSQTLKWIKSAHYSLTGNAQRERKWLTMMTMPNFFLEKQTPLHHNPPPTNSFRICRQE